jgi:uncharacterized protein (TIGR03435 family)
MKQTLGKFLDRYFNPSNKQVEEAGERVLQRLQRGTAIASQHVELPRRNWHVSIAFAAAAVILVVALSAMLVRPNEVNASMMTLADGSRVELKSGADASVEPASDGLRIKLKTGSIIVRAAKQAPGRHLYVRTKDVDVSVVGTVFLVKADDNGSHVAVFEGEVRVQQNGQEKNLHPGEQTSSNEKLQALALQAEIGWSHEASAYLAMLHQSLAQSVAARQNTPRGAVIPGKPQFDVASVRPCEEDFKTPEGMRGGGSNSMRMSPGRFDALCMTVATLIRTAHRRLENNSMVPGSEDSGFSMNATYGLGMENGTRVRSGPDWAYSDKFTISAVTEGRVDAPTMSGPMLINLLESRFQLKMHVGTEGTPVWTLTVAKGGLKIKPTDPGSCLQRVCGPSDRGESRAGPNFKLIAEGWSLDSLVQRLSLTSRRLKSGRALPLSSTLDGLPILNKTGIPEATLFDFTLEYGADADFLAAGSPPDTAKDPGGPTIFEALEKLGLELKKSTAPREFIVIDHVEKPSPN